MRQASTTIASVKDLRIAFRMEGRLSVPVRGVSLEIPERGRIALVGESGSGKSLTAMAIGGLVERAEISGEIRCAARPAYVFQNPMASLNPVMRVGRQIVEASGTDDSAGDLLESVGLPRSFERRYPCELSGGQCQRVMMAMALSRHPKLLIADEPTTALDVTTQKEILDLIDRLAEERGMAVLLITHNLGIVADHSDSVYVMYAGQIVEEGRVARVMKRPLHPYTRGLLAAVPRLDAPKGAELVDIPGTVPPPWGWPEGCAFRPRCPHAAQFQCR